MGRLGTGFRCVAWAVTQTVVFCLGRWRTIGHLGVLVAGLAVAAAPSAWAEPLPPEVAALETEASHNDVSAQFELARIYDQGQAVPPDLRKAREWYCAAARHGNPEAAWRLGQIFLMGWGVPVDIRNSQDWVRLAAKNGHSYAQAMAQAMGKSTSGQAPSCTPRRESFASVSYHPLPYRPGEVPRPPSDFSSPAPERIVSLVRVMAPRYHLDPDLVLAVIEAESGFQAGSVSNRGACGLMQMIPETAARFGVTDIFDPEDNLRGGMSYLRWLLARFEGDVELALAGYNAGEGAVENYGGVPPFSETRTYVRRILSHYPSSRHPYDASAAAPSKLLSRAGGG